MPCAMLSDLQAMRRPSMLKAVLLDGWWKRRAHELRLWWGLKPKTSLSRAALPKRT